MGLRRTSPRRLSHADQQLRRPSRRPNRQRRRSHRAKKLKLQDIHDPTVFYDVGQVGEIESINPAVVKALQDDAFIPVISPIGVGDDELSYNINADVVAGKMAETLKAEKLVMLTNTPGVLDKEGNLITGLTSQEIDALFADGTISGGMYPRFLQRSRPPETA